MLKNPQTNILWGIPFIFFVASIFHFVYDISKNNFLVGLIAPVNESVFEHLKLIPIPLIAWWSIFYFLNKDSVDIDLWFSCALVSLLTSLILVPLIFYFYTESFAVEFVIVDILILFIAVIIGQCLALHYYKHGTAFDYRISLGIIFGIIALFAFFTVVPPKFPIFMETSSGTYGIRKTA